MPLLRRKTASSRSLTRVDQPDDHHWHDQPDFRPSSRNSELSHAQYMEEFPSTSVKQRVYRPPKGIQFWWEAFTEDIQPPVLKSPFHDNDRQQCTDETGLSTTTTKKKLSPNKTHFKRHPLKSNPISSKYPASDTFPPRTCSSKRSLQPRRASAPPSPLTSPSSSGIGIYGGYHYRSSSSSSSSASCSTIKAQYPSTRLHVKQKQKPKRETIEPDVLSSVHWTDSKCMQSRSGLFIRGQIVQTHVYPKRTTSSKTLSTQADAQSLPDSARWSTYEVGNERSILLSPVTSEILDWAPPSPFMLRMSRLCPSVTDCGSSLLDRRGRKLDRLKL